MLTEFITSPLFVAILFFAIAFIYSSVGLGGGSSYTAVMALLGFSTVVIPTVSLMLNMLVTTVGSYNFIRQKHVRFKLIAPFLISSMPMAYLGGTLHLPKQLFFWLLLVSLVFVAIRIYFWRNTTLGLILSVRQKISISLLAGAVLGFIAGVVGIGGGIYLVPLIIILGLGSQKEAAACGAIFVWLNSVAGLTARFQYHFIDLRAYIPLIIAVILGGIFGSYLGASRFSAKTIEKVLGMVVLIAIGFLIKKLIFV